MSRAQLFKAFNRDYLSFPSKNVELLWQIGDEGCSGLCRALKPKLILVEEQVYKLHTSYFEGEEVEVFPGREAHKSWSKVAELLKLLLEHNIDRRSSILAVGGGAHMDLVGFAASIYQRGVPLIALPTSLLAMVDAAIGGKNGVNFEGYKNLVGSIVQPQTLVIDTRFLDSLPEASWSDGFAEIIKYACIADQGLYAALAHRDVSFYKSSKEELRALIHRCIRHKVRLIGEDEEDRAGQRVVLNFGHSLAHALERTLGCSHGEAVAYGMMFSAWISVQKGFLSAQSYEQLHDLLHQYGLSSRIEADPYMLFEAFLGDKKRYDASIEEVLLKDIGRPVVLNLCLSFVRECLIRYANEYSLSL